MIFNGVFSNLREFQGSFRAADELTNINVALSTLTRALDIYSSIMEHYDNVVFMSNVIVYNYGKIDNNIILHLYIPTCYNQQSYDVFTRKFSSYEVNKRCIVVDARYCLNQENIITILQDLDAGFISYVSVSIKTSGIDDHCWRLKRIIYKNAIDIKGVLNSFYGSNPNLSKYDISLLNDIKKYCDNDVISTEKIWADWCENFKKSLQEKNMKKFDKFIVSGPVTVGKINGKDIKIRLHDGDESDPEKAILTLFAKSFFPNNSQYLKWMNEQMDLMRDAISFEETRLKKKAEKKPKKKSNIAIDFSSSAEYEPSCETIVTNTTEPSCEEKCWKKCQQLQDYSRCGHCKYSYRCPSTANADWMEKVARYEAKLPVQTITEEESNNTIKDQPIAAKDQGGEHWPWNEQELDYLYKHKNDSNISIANALGRSISSVATKKSNLKLGHKRSVWTTKELDILKNAKDKTMFDLAKELPNHTFEAIRTKLSKLGLEYKHIK